MPLRNGHESAKVYQGQNWLLRLFPEKPKRSRAAGRGFGTRAKHRSPDQTTNNWIAQDYTPRLDADANDLVSVDDDDRGYYWRKWYSSEIRRKSKGETSHRYHIEYCGVSADGEYYEHLEWRPMFGKQNTNTYRYWNKNGSFYESYPDYSDYYSRCASHERYISPKYGGFLRTKQSHARMFKKAPFFASIVMERTLNSTRGPGNVFQPPWIAERRANRNISKDRAW